ncbi:hypothetical protein EMCG_00836 [[Emmonsia] crescens]|uniref:Uncharacterized protein n=1 Tax=[Emmonsia] crescens TaxID=73230 RepID=A0A0G2IXU3_9EURO|nr:hypothetical protein EMCG_00836 [Emmonsia crescens UAMH 3008]
MDARDSQTLIALEHLDQNQVAREYYGEGSHATPDDRSSNKVSLDGVTIGPDHSEQPPRNKKLRRRKTSLCLVAFYVAISAFSWVVLCVLSRQHGSTKLGIMGTRLYRAAKFSSGAAAVFAFPVATALCARAVVPYAQAKRNGLTLRQTMFLADRAWANPQMWSRSTISKKQSLFFWSAVWLHVIGFVIFPLQQVLVGEGIVKYPREYGHVSSMIDFSDLFGEDPTPGSVLVQKLRYAITSVILDDVDPYIWVNNSDCDLDYQESTPPHWKSFISPALSTFNTGVLRQFAPRLNSTVSFKNVSMDDFPADCANLPGSFYAEYFATSNDKPRYSVQACMPSNQTNSPWKNQFRTPQTISEVLYLKIFVNGDRDRYTITGFSGGPAVFKVQADSTSGYFELPNYLNNNTASDLLPRDPDEFCDEHCTDQGYSPLIVTNNRAKWSASRKPTKRWTSDFTTIISPGTREQGEYKAHMEYENSGDVDDRVNLGPLYTVAEALFGNSSFIAARSHSPLEYVGSAISNYPGLCRDLAPLVGLMTEHRSRNSDVRQARLDCVGRPSHTHLILQVSNWLGLFWSNDTSVYRYGRDPKFVMERTLTAAVYLAHKGWFLDGNPRYGNFGIELNMGTDVIMPVISTAGIIVISVLLSIFLLGLIAIAGYVSSVPTFTATVDAFVMLRLGAELSVDDSTGPLPALSANAMSMDALDRKPGWFGDGKPDEEVGRVELGANARLRNGREYGAN